MANVVIFGAGDIARLAHYYFERDSEHRVVAFTVDATHRKAEEFLDLPLVDFERLPDLFPPCTWLTDHPVGRNCFVLEDNTVQPFVRLGHNVTLWSGNHVGHDVVIDDHCFVSSHVVISGHVRIGARSFVGVNATLRNAITLAPRSLIGAGAVITSDTVEGGVYVPARSTLLERSSEQVRL